MRDHIRGPRDLAFRGLLKKLYKNYSKTKKKTVQEVQVVDLARAPGLESWLFDETVSQKLGSRTRIVAFC